MPGAVKVLIAQVPMDASFSQSESALDMRLGLADRIFRAASGVRVDLFLEVDVER